MKYGTPNSRLVRCRNTSAASRARERFERTVSRWAGSVSLGAWSQWRPWGADPTEPIALGHSA